MPPEPTEAAWEQYALDWLGEWGWKYLPGAAIAPGAQSELKERRSWDELVLIDRLRAAIERINPSLPPAAVDEAMAEVLRRQSQDTLAESFRIHKRLTEGLPVSYADADGAERNPTAWLLDFNDPSYNEFIAVNQVIVKRGQHERRLDIVCYVNGLPLAVFELKKPPTKRPTARPRITSSRPTASSSVHPCSPSPPSQWRATASPPGSAHYSRPGSISPNGTSTTGAARSASPTAPRSRS
jgi:type I site-specific restriction-modification system R (restriction) subunit